MATRSTIARQKFDGTIESIYCHWDGYPAGVGYRLAEYYTTAEKIDQLFALGDLSVLGAEIGSKKDFDTSVLNDECLAYGRDRGEHGVEAKVHETYVDFINTRADQGCEFAYLWNGVNWETANLD